MSKRNQGLGFAAFLIAIIVIGTAPLPPEEPDPWDIHAYPWSTLPNDLMMSPDGQCNDFNVVGSPIDDDGNGYANEADPSCIKLWDSNGNGICDARVWGMSWDEGIFAPYTEMSCTGWE